MEDLAPRQREILEYIAAIVDQKGVAPTYREIGDALNIKSTNGVSDHVKALIRKGYLQRPGGHGSARSLRLTDRATTSFHDQATVGIPVIGRVAAGLPILAEENFESTLRLDASMVPAGATCFALRVTGDSMIEDGILDGDLVVVRQQQTARDGEIVVARVDDEATVKRFYREKGRVRLQPANSEMSPIYVDATADLNIVGRVVGLVRSF